ncbi:putative E3 ubiquitin-protein ligase itt1 [Glarea lozoyensis 74030]|uniref:Putative E3 ubiquitin-protein ligase itt1 n=1 Tax=Glarea lozoyensis (strain ATCC 74030 / MF5533) TaxID=1104152 RepID=H0ECA2_GLAL7|nr:putative E3 ubiquitin-protein ligase itt1 [Glarea lozoyensis 74030]
MDLREESDNEAKAIFPEIILNPNEPFSATIDLQVKPSNPVKVVFPAAADGILPTPPHSDTSSQHEGEPTRELENRSKFESHDLSYLPSLHLSIALPEGYPEEKPPQFKLSTNPAWLSRTHLDELEAYGKTMWEEAGRAVVAYGYIDFLQQSAENAFGFAEKGRLLEIPQDHKISLLDLDIRATQAAFAKETFDCGVCLDPKKGLVCHRMIDCGHVFCVECLQDFYNNAIKEGDLTFVRCLDPDCAKNRIAAQAASKKKRKVKTQLSPSELLQIPLEPEIVARYVKLKRKAALESDKNTIYCPRSWCQGAARSTKHKKSVGLEADDSSDEEGENDEQAAKAPNFLRNLYLRQHQPLLRVVATLAAIDKPNRDSHNEETYVAFKAVELMFEIESLEISLNRNLILMDKKQLNKPGCRCLFKWL